MSDTPADRTQVNVADLSARKPWRFDLRPDAETCARIAETFELLDLRKVSLTGDLTAEGKDAWRLRAKLGATVVQPCIVTLAPVTTRIDMPVERLFTDDWEETVTGEEIEMPEDDTMEPLSRMIDIMAVLTESLGLALPDYPRADDAALETSTFTAPGVTPMRDEDIKPFAGLAGLKAKLKDPDAE